MIDVLRIAHLRIAPQEGNLEVGNCEGNLTTFRQTFVLLKPVVMSSLLLLFTGVEFLFFFAGGGGAGQGVHQHRHLSRQHQGWSR